MDTTEKAMKKLPDAEFDVMKVVWATQPPITTAEIMKQLGVGKEWKIQTIVSLMQRLMQRGFLRSEKHGKERFYFPLVEKDDYLTFETGNFLKYFHDNSLSNLVTALHGNDSLTDKDIDELMELTKTWKKERRG